MPLCSLNDHKVKRVDVHSSRTIELLGNIVSLIRRNDRELRFVVKVRGEFSTKQKCIGRG